MNVFSVISKSLIDKTLEYLIKDVPNEVVDFMKSKGEEIADISVIKLSDSVKEVCYTTDKGNQYIATFKLPNVFASKYELVDIKKW